MGECYFSDAGASFLSAGVPHGGASVLMGGGRFKKKSLDGGAAPPHYGKP